jgi:hypothetical protein
MYWAATVPHPSRFAQSTQMNNIKTLILHSILLIFTTEMSLRVPLRDHTELFKTFHYYQSKVFLISVNKVR